MTSSSPHLVQGGLIAFDPRAHGGSQSSSFADPSYLHLSVDTADKIAHLQAKLNQKLGPEFISQRPGPGGAGKLTYAEGWKIINIANEVFGFNGWSSSVVSLTTDYVDFLEDTRRYNVGATAIVRVTLRDGVFHEDVGYGTLENSKSKGAALDKCKKEAVTDGLKRALRNFGNLLGNCLYDKSYTQEVVKIKVPPVKFDKDKLYRKPEFDDSKPQVPPTTTTSNSNAVASTSHSAVKISQAPIAPKPEVKQEAQASKPQPCLPDRRPQYRTTATPPSHITPPPPPPPQEQEPETLKGGPDRHVTFAETTVVKSEDSQDSYPFNSDDEAFLSTVDLGEGDLGRPIVEDVDLGRPIDFGEGRGVVGLGDTSITVDAGATAVNQQQQTRGGQAAYVNHQRLKDNTPHQQCHATNALPARSQANPIIAPNSLPRQQQQQQQPQQRALLPSNQNVNAPQVNSKSFKPSETKRPHTPSVGGFHFPPGMNLPAGQSQNIRPAEHGQTDARRTLANPSVGAKRPADSMQRPTQGMGLAYQQSIGSRQSLAHLQGGEGGDMKRTRR